MKFKADKKTLLFMIFLSAIALFSCTKEISSDERVTQAKTLLASENYKEAVIQLKKALQTEPDNRDARLLLGEVYILLGDGPSAEKELKHAGRLGENKPGIKILLGKAFILQKKYKQALDVLQVSDMETGEKKSLVLSLRGQVYLQQADFELADKAYRQAISLDKNNAAAYIGMAKLALNRSNFSEVEKYLKQALAVDPKEKEVWIVKGQMYRQLGKLPEAEQTFKRVLTKNKIVTEQEYNATINLINVQILLGKLDEAGKHISALSRVLPHHPYPKYLKAWLAYQKKNYTLTNTLLLELQKKIPDHMPSLLLLGASNYALGNYEQANVFLTRFVNRMPTHIQARKLLGAVRLMLNQPKKAMDVLRPALNGDDKDAGLLAMAGMAVASLGGHETQLHYLEEAVKLEPDNISIRAELARAYMRRGEFDDAIDILKPLQKEKGMEGVLLSTYAYIRSEKYTEARKLINKILKERGGTPVLYVLLGTVELFSGRREQAKNYFNMALSLDHDFLVAHLNLARMALEDGNLSAASKIFDKVLMVNEKSVEAMIGHAQIAEQRGDRKNVILWLERAREADDRTLMPRILLAKYYLGVKKSDLALKIAEEIYAIAPNEAGSFLLLGKAQIFSGKANLAAETYEKLVRRYPENPLAFVELANARFILGQEKDGRLALSKALELDPSLISARIGLIRLALRLGDSDSALSEAKKIQAMQKKSNIGFILEGDIYIQEHKYEEAIQAYRQALKIDASVEAALKLSQAYMASGKLKKSLRALLLASKKYPEDSRLKSALGAYYQANNNVLLAEKYYKQVLEQHPANLVVLNNLAVLLSEKDLAQAIKYAQRAYKQASDNAAIGDTLGWLLLKNDEIERALPILEDVARRNQNPVIQYHYAVALEKSGRQTEAVAVLKRALSSSSQFTERQLAQSLLQQLERKD